MESVQRKKKETAKKVKFSSRFYSSIEWQTVREMAIRRDFYLCQDCLKKNLITPAEEVHHIIKLTPDNINDPEIALNLDNLVSLCKDCHAARHSQPKRYKLDEFGRVEIR